ncbi:hypothetical protein WDW37_17635 [Bdellovibrionota bacterium FG-1]
MSNQNEKSKQQVKLPEKFEKIRGTKPAPSEGVMQEGLDFSDLNGLLAQAQMLALAKAKSKRV